MTRTRYGRPPAHRGPRSRDRYAWAAMAAMRSHTSLAPAADVQARPPSVPIGLWRVGVTGVEKVIRIGEELYFAQLECVVDLGPEQKGAHMSRFEEVINEAIGRVVLGESGFGAETLAE